ncbi:hypothetical protein DPMN_082614 [Dreissena polymorpha]|uniref:Uncharacterized protein n=1 Tax=Dreissena polymorpha TaxID=45954 RepID=A0A9D3Y783_DREPO|nr:hypothetical protein DPMN_082614 [Dreissena polymorpha]
MLSAVTQGFAVSFADKIALNQTARMLWLVWSKAGRIYHKTHFSERGSFIKHGSVD